MAAQDEKTRVRRGFFVPESNNLLRLLIRERIKSIKFYMQFHLDFMAGCIWVQLKRQTPMAICGLIGT